jgi:hypothetical protein
MKQKRAFALMTGIIATGIVSFMLISINLEFGDRFLLVWIRSWPIAHTAVIPVMLIIGPGFQKVVDKIFKLRVS